MKTNRIRLTESQLRRMVSEAVKNVLKEHDPYFWQDMYHNYMYDYHIPGSLDLTRPATKYAHADVEKSPSKEKLSKLNDFGKDNNYPSPPESEFDAASRLHTLRQNRAELMHNKLDDTYRVWAQRVKLHALKQGIPMEQVLKLSPSELIKLYSSDDDFE